MRSKVHKSLVSNTNAPSHPHERNPIPAEAPSYPQKQKSIPADVPSYLQERDSIPAERDSIPDESSFPRKRESILNTISSHLPNQILTSAFSPSHLQEQNSIPHRSRHSRARESILACAAAGANPSRHMSLSLSPPHIRLAVSLILGMLLLLLLPSAIAAADGVISGTVVNGTADGSVPADVAVTLYFLRDGEIVEQRTQVTGPEGAYSFSDLPTDPMLAFVVVAAYTQVPYNTPELKFYRGYRGPSAPTHRV